MSGEPCRCCAPDALVHRPSAPRARCAAAVGAAAGLRVAAPGRGLGFQAGHAGCGCLRLAAGRGEGARPSAAFFGVAAMFSAQRAGPARTPMGLNAHGAEQNAQFALNLLYWLAR